MLTVSHDKEMDGGTRVEHASHKHVQLPTQLVQVKVKFTLEQATKAQRGSRGIVLSLTSALDGGEWSTPRPGLFTPGKDPVQIV
jgi:hypothetical protein